MLTRKQTSIRYAFVFLFLITLFSVLVTAPVPRKVGAQSSQRVTASLPGSMDWLKREKSLGMTDGLLRHHQNVMRASADSPPRASSGSGDLSVIGKHPGATSLFEQSQKLSSGSVNFQQQGAKSPTSVSPDAVTVPCLSGAMTDSDPGYSYPELLVPMCQNGGVTDARYDHYLLTLAGCATFPTSVTITTCGPVGCAAIPIPPGGTGLDTVIAVYRKGGATAGTSGGSGFNAADPCGTSTATQRLVGVNDDTPGCGGAGGIQSSITMMMGPGDFDVVVSGFDNSQPPSVQGRGMYNLSVTAASPGCTVTQQPTAADGTVSGRIVDGNGGPVSGAVVNLSGSQSRRTITDANGNYRFDEVETNGFYTVTPSRANYSFSPGNRSFSLVGNNTDADFAGLFGGDIENPSDTTEYFVRQQYLDFLGREPDEGGFGYWSDLINQCNGDAACTRQRRIDVSAAFFGSAEFQQTGSYVHGLYAGTLGRTLSYGEFNADRSQVLGGAGLDQAKTAFAEGFVQRPEFTSRYPQSMNREEFVDAVIQSMQVRSGMFMTSYRNGFLSDYDVGGRALVVRHAAEASDFVAAEYNKALVLMEYFGYLRRDIDPGGYAFWLDVLNSGAGSRGMVCAFVTSGEYQARFSTVVTHNNGECDQ